MRPAHSPLTQTLLTPGSEAPREPQGMTSAQRLRRLEGNVLAQHFPSPAALRGTRSRPARPPAPPRDTQAAATATPSRPPANRASSHQGALPAPLCSPPGQPPRPAAPRHPSSSPASPPRLTPEGAASPRASRRRRCPPSPPHLRAEPQRGQAGTRSAWGDAPRG